MHLYCVHLYLRSALSIMNLGIWCEYNWRTLVSCTCFLISLTMAAVWTTLALWLRDVQIVREDICLENW